MRLLLDTHIWLWSVLEPRRLSKRVAKALDHPSNELWLSPISTWEVMILAAKGRITLRSDPETWIRMALATIPFKEATLNHEVALQSRKLSLQDGDPADLFLVATALVYELTLVTADLRLVRSRLAPILANR